MRRAFLNEGNKEEGSTNYKPSESSEEQLPEQAATQKKVPKATAPHSEKGSPLKGKLLRGALITFGTLGIASLLVPVLVGVPLGDLLQSSNLSSAYSGSSLASLRISGALQLGNLPAATEALLSLPNDSVEFGEHVETVFNRLLEAKEYERAAQVLRYTRTEKDAEKSGAPLPTIFDFLSVQAPVRGMQSSSKSMVPSDIGIHMGKNQSLEKSLEQLSQEPNLKALRPQLISHVLYAATPRELPSLEKLAPTLKGWEQGTAMMVIAYNYIKAEDWEAAMRWTKAMPAEYQRLGNAYVSGELARVDPKPAIEHLLAQPQDTLQFKTELISVLQAIAYVDPKQIETLLPQLKSPQLRELTIGFFLTQTTMHYSPNPKKVFWLIDKQKDPAIKAWTLVRYLLSWAQFIPGTAKHEYILKEVIPRMTALARQNPKLIPLHDQLLRYQISRNSPPKQYVGRYISLMLDPTTKASLKKEWDKGKIPTMTPESVKVLVQAGNTGFDLKNPADAGKLTGLRD
ncbi:MAG: hypothetical protein QM758_07325 [Armatimonas sp.]